MKRKKRTELNKNSILNMSAETRAEFQRRYGTDDSDDIWGWREHKKRNIKNKTFIQKYTNEEFSIQKCQENLFNQIKNIKGYFINTNGVLERIK